MFQKKDYIYSENLGVCRVDEITKLSTKKEEQILYYGLRKEFDKTKTSYVPVEGHKVVLRELISKEEAMNKLENSGNDNINELELEEIAFVLEKDLEEIRKDVKQSGAEDK